jgi:RsiW-degrading membrane proteinase PrsW (M82 family)
MLSLCGSIDALGQISTGGHLPALALAVLIGIVYLAIVRFIDLNEKEPLWALGLLFAIGAVASVLPLIVPSIERTLRPWVGATADQIAMFLAIFAGMAALDAIGRLRGWSEVTGLMDGMVYGAAAGLGFATGQAFIGILGSEGSFPGLTPSHFSLFWTHALVGLIDGVFGAIIGAGFGAAAYARDPVKKFAPPVLSLVVAVAANGGYRILSRGDALSGDSGFMRMWIALLIPVVLVVIVAAIALLREKQAITTELESERAGGVVTGEDMEMLSNAIGRQITYLKLLGTGQITRLAGLRMIHNREVMLALTKRRLAGETDPERRAAVEAEAQHLRDAIIATRNELSSAGTGAATKGGAL